MGAFAMPVALGLMASGTVTSAVGAHRQGKAEARAARFNAEQIRRETMGRLEQFHAEQRRMESSNITRVAKSGVRLSGSPLEVMENNRYQADLQAENLRFSGMVQSELQRMRGKSAENAARLGVASEVVGGAGRIGALAVNHYA